MRTPSSRFGRSTTDIQFLHSAPDITAHEIPEPPLIQNTLTADGFVMDEPGRAR